LDPLEQKRAKKASLTKAVKGGSEEKKAQGKRDKRFPDVLMKIGGMEKKSNEVFGRPCQKDCQGGRAASALERTSQPKGEAKERIRTPGEEG